MAFHALLVVRDEGDLIAQTLDHVLSWCDTLSVLDTGSTDGTWEILQARAAGEPRAIRVQRSPVRFSEGLRAMLFESARPRFRTGDWVGRLDADEHYDVPPPVFIRERVRRPEGRVYAQHYEFVLTQSEAAAWESGRESLADRARPIRDRRRRYLPDLYPEIRFFRYRRGMRWSPDRYEPFNAGLLARERIPVRHYRCRDPEQIKARCALRAAMAPGLPHEHWRQEDWRKWVIPDDEPRLREWKPGEAMPPVDIPGWVPRDARRAAQWAFYATGAVRLADLTRPRFPLDFGPVPLPERPIPAIHSPPSAPPPAPPPVCPPSTPS